MQEDQTKNLQPTTQPKAKSAPKRRWILIAGVTAAVVLTLGAGVVYGSTLTGSAKAAGSSNTGFQTTSLNQSSKSASSSIDSTPGASSSVDTSQNDSSVDSSKNDTSVDASQSDTNSKDSSQSSDTSSKDSSQSGDTGTQDVYDSLTVTSVNGSTITAKDVNGNTVTIQTTSSTVYTENDATVSSSAVKQGLKIDVRGTKNSDGSVTATKVEIG